MIITVVYIISGYSGCDTDRHLDPLGERRVREPELLYPGSVHRRSTGIPCGGHGQNISALTYRLGTMQCLPQPK
jgi:hypothetical protein